jgi:serine O-acetyltransferase
MFFKKLREDINFAKKVDPAARNKFEIFMTYSGVHALSIHRGANFLHRIHLKFLARWLSQFGKWLTGIEIHPAAQIAGGVFIDHGTGVVIGETSIVETEVTIYQGVTLGGTGKDKGARRHPTVKKGAIISCGAKVLGNITIGENSVVGASSVVLKDVPPNSTAVGIPARIVKINGEKVREGYDIPDIVKEEIDSLKMRVEQLEKMLNLQKGEQNESL